MFERLQQDVHDHLHVMPGNGKTAPSAVVPTTTGSVDATSPLTALLAEARLSRDTLGRLHEEVRTLAKENRHLHAALDPSQQELRHHEFMAPVVRTLVTCLRETRDVVRRARRQSEAELNQALAGAYDLVARHFSASATRMQSALSLYGVVESHVSPGEPLDCSRHIIVNEKPAPSDSAIGTVARVVANAWVDQRSGQVYCPALVDVYVSARGR